MKKGFSLTETVLVMVIAGIIAILYAAGIKLYNPTQKGFDVKSKKILENIDQAITLILAHHAPNFTLTFLNDTQGSFSINDEGASGRLAALFKENINIIDMEIEQKYNSYYSSPIKDFNGTSTGITLNSVYDNFMMSANGVIYGYRLYSTCNSDEELANPPLVRGKYKVSNICGSIFYDVNAYRGPNKLGSDQYIVPIDANGTEYKKI